MKKLKKLKRAVIKEELVALTGDFASAIVLNQLIYWSERVSDFDKFIEQEKARAEEHGENINIDTTCGWIYKTAEELSEETMLNVSRQSMRSYLKKLIDSGYIQERANPKYKWDKTKQYRVNIAKIQTDLKEIGYCLEGYPLVIECDSERQKNNIREENLDVHSPILDVHSNKILPAIPETTTKINTDIYNRAHKKRKIHDLNMDSQRANNFMSHTGAPSDFNGDLNDWYLECMDGFK